MIERDAKVSVIIPAYNVEAYIERAIDSIIRQTYENVEIVVVDDGSTDSTYEVIRRYVGVDSRVKAYKTENAGVSNARNIGLDNASGEYVLFLDSDDWLEIDTVESLIEKAYNGYDLVCSSCFFVNENGGVEERKEQNIGVESQEMFRNSFMQMVGDGNFLHLSSSCYKLFVRRIIEKKHLRFDKNIYYGEDGLFTFSYLLECNHIYYYNKPLWNILERPDSATSMLFNKRMISGIYAVDKMLGLDKKAEAKVNLYALKAERALVYLSRGLKSNEASLKDLRYAQNILWKYRKNLIKRDRNIRIRLAIYKYCVWFYFWLLLRKREK